MARYVFRSLFICTTSIVFVSKSVLFTLLRTTNRSLTAHRIFAGSRRDSGEELASQALVDGFFGCQRSTSRPQPSSGCTELHWSLRHARYCNHSGVPSHPNNEKMHLPFATRRPPCSPKFGFASEWDVVGGPAACHSR